MAGRTLYHLHSLRAADGGGLSAIEGWLDHVVSLGCGGVLLTPIHTSSTHGYDTVDPFRLDPRLGDDAAFEAESDDFYRRRSDGSVRVWEGHDELVELDHANPAVLEWAVRVCTHWLDRGADGWRLDVAYSIPPAFLRALAERVRAAHPSAFLFGEMIHGDYAGFVRASGLDSVTAYELHKAIWSSLHDANPHELAWALQRHAEAAATFSPVTFVGNHDVSRLASLVATPEVQVPVAMAVLFTVPGVPCLYYGDELGALGVKVDGAGGDDAVRPALSSLDRFGSPELAGVVRDLVTWRRERPWLTDGVLSVDEVSNASVRYTVRSRTSPADAVTVEVRPDGYAIS